MLFHKTEPDRMILHVEVDPPAILTFGTGEPPDEKPLVIDKGWEQSAGWNFPEESSASNDSDNEREQLTVRAGEPPPRMTRRQSGLASTFGFPAIG